MSDMQRTITYKVQMLTKEGKQEGRAFQTTLTGIKGSSDQAKESLVRLGDTISKKTGTQFKVLTKNNSEFSASLRQSVRDMNKANKEVDNITREYALMVARIDKSAEEQAILNAQFRLGKGATEQQKTEVAKLVKQYFALENAQNRNNKSMRNFRGQMNNFGFQMQDIIVQTQMGTNAFMIFSQQGSQLAASFGRNGPVIGAVIALVGVLGMALFPNLKKNTDEAENLANKMRELSKTTGLTGFQSLQLINIEKKKIKANEESIKSYNDQIQALTTLNETYADYEKRKKKEMVDAARSNREQTIQVLTAEQFNKKKEEEIDLLIELNSNIDTEKAKRLESLEAIQMYHAATSGGIDTQKRNVESNKQIVDALRDQIDVLGLSRASLLKRERDIKLSILAQQNAKQAEKDFVQAGYETLIVLEQQKQAYADNEKAKRENARAQQELNDLLTRTGDESTLLSNLESRYQKEFQMLSGHLDAQKALTEQYERDRLKIVGTAWQQYMIAVEENLGNFDQLAQNSIENFTRGFGSAIASAVVDSESLGEAMENVFKGMLRSMIAFFAEWAAQELILWTLKQFLGSTAQASAATTMSSNAAAMALMSGLNAFSSTAAIPIIGPILAPGAMAAALATATPMATAISGLAFAGVYDRGGIIPQDALGIVSEYGEELVNGVLVRGNQGGTNVTSREDTAKLLNAGGSSGGMQFNIYGGNATPEQIANQVIRKLRSGRGTKNIDKELYKSMQRGARTRGVRA